MWSMGGGDDPRFEKYNRGLTFGVNRWIARHPLLTPLIGFAIVGLLVAFDHVLGRSWGPFTRIGLLIGVFSSLLLIYGVILTLLNRLDRR